MKKSIWVVIITGIFFWAQAGVAETTTNFQYFLSKDQTFTVTKVITTKEMVDKFDNVPKEITDAEEARDLIMGEKKFKSVEDNVVRHYEFGFPIKAWKETSGRQIKFEQKKDKRNWLQEKTFSSTPKESSDFMTAILLFLPLGIFFLSSILIFYLRPKKGLAAWFYLSGPGSLLAVHFLFPILSGLKAEHYQMLDLLISVLPIFLATVFVIKGVDSMLGGMIAGIIGFSIGAVISTVKNCFSENDFWLYFYFFIAVEGGAIFLAWIIFKIIDACKSCRAMRLEEAENGGE